MSYEHIILGGTGHVGGAVAEGLLATGAAVLVVGHSADKATEWEQKGAAYQVADIMDSEKLHSLFALGKRLFILNPPAPPDTDTVAVETKSMQAILKALEGCSLEKIVAASTYGAQTGTDIGDLGVLYQLEQGLSNVQTPVAIIRSAYYMSNWDMDVKTAKEGNPINELYPVDFKLPMVAPQDIGAFAATLMTNNDTGLHFIEGPERYSPNDVATALGTVLSKEVTVNSVAENQWIDFLKNAGFFDAAARYMANMTRITIDGKYEVVAPHNGTTTLQEYFRSIAGA